MPQQKMGDTGKLFFQQAETGADVVHHPLPAAPGTEVQPRPAGGHGAAVAQVVVARHRKAPGGEILREGLIPEDILRHAVGDLQNRPGPALRQPLHRVDSGLPVGGGERKFIAHHGTEPPVHLIS